MSASCKWQINTRHKMLQETEKRLAETWNTRGKKLVVSAETHPGPFSTVVNERAIANCSYNEKQPHSCNRNTSIR